MAQIWSGWDSCIRWCSKNPVILASFEREVGYRFPDQSDPIDRLMAEAVGAAHHNKVMTEFVLWVTVCYYGAHTPGVPRGVLESLKKRGFQIKEA